MPPYTLQWASAGFGYLGSNRVRAGGEELADTRHIEAGLSQAEGCPEPCSAGADYHGIERMVNHIVGRLGCKSSRKRCPGS